ncbi:hypothetical protein BDB00DRAFT_867145 [Zychaea mexicana]|uniref:uncharacterized protein n=1 Tax=Zychaea mexicana TaxID=64656 RepID=UPI0022FF258A|nr:uncharacterized protein BDB00DRAFT_867145 [Zychaea mexicana]KAI9499072.1 hypothetical protein BDB00DRAFT_867145 [Zychaea mexicana]
MKFSTAATILFAMFVASAVALPRGNYHNDYHNDGGDDTVDLKGCTEQGDLTGLLPAVLQAGVLSNNHKKCVQAVKDVDH